MAKAVSAKTAPVSIRFPLELLAELSAAAAAGNRSVAAIVIERLQAIASLEARVRELERDGPAFPYGRSNVAPLTVPARTVDRPSRVGGSLMGNPVLASPVPEGLAGEVTPILKTPPKGKR